jgi:hypothetical protein
MGGHRPGYRRAPVMTTSAARAPQPEQRSRTAHSITVRGVIVPLNQVGDAGVYLLDGRNLYRARGIPRGKIVPLA